jgi:Flp pilus assembly protein CpaB
VPELPLDTDGVRPRLRPRVEEAAPARQSPSRRLLQPLPLAGIALVVVALVGYIAVYNQTTRRTGVLVAARDLPAGTTLRAGDLRTAGLAGDNAVLSALIPAREADLVVGRRISVAVSAGQPLPQSTVSPRTAVPSAFTVAVPVLHALGGALRPGDRVSVLATFESAAGGARTRAIARNLAVIAVGTAPTTFDRSTATVPVTLALPNPSLASALALANEAGKIDLLREGSRVHREAIPPAEVGG